MHNAPLLKQIKTAYRKGCWAIDDEVTGGIIQVQQTIAQAVRERRPDVKMPDEFGDPTGEELSLHQPKGFLLIGNQNQFKTDIGINWQKTGSFELFRRNETSPEIITYDQLLDRAKYIVKHS